jgi:hypothetical protein
VRVVACTLQKPWCLTQHRQNTVGCCCLTDSSLPPSLVPPHLPARISAANALHMQPQTQSMTVPLQYTISVKVYPQLAISAFPGSWDMLTTHARFRLLYREAPSLPVYIRTLRDS